MAAGLGCVAFCVPDVGWNEILPAGIPGRVSKAEL